MSNLNYNKERLSKYESALGGVPIPPSIQAQTAMSVGSSEFIHTLMQQTTKTPQQIALDSINKNVKKITKNVKQSSGNTPAVVII